MSCENSWKSDIALVILMLVVMGPPLCLAVQHDVELGGLGVPIQEDDGGQVLVVTQDALRIDAEGETGVEITNLSTDLTVMVAIHPDAYIPLAKATATAAGGSLAFRHQLVSLWVWVQPEGDVNAAKVRVRRLGEIE